MTTNTKKIKGRQSRKGKTMENLESWINKQASKLQLSIKETAEFIGKGQQYVRMGLQTRRLKFGSAVQTREPTRTRPRGAWDYDIQRIQVERYVGMSYKKFLELKYVN
jgi:hypothetical protein